MTSLDEIVRLKNLADHFKNTYRVEKRPDGNFLYEYKDLVASNLTDELVNDLESLGVDVQWIEERPGGE